MTNTMNRAYLEGMMDKYLEALVSHDPSRLPLSSNVKFTENTIPLKPGEALWQTASALPTYKLYVCDPQTGQVGLFALMRENDYPIILSARLKISKKAITEIETVVVREGGMPITDDNMKETKPLYLEALKPEEKMTREEMIRISDLYFDALEQDKGDLAPFWDECNRVENGMQTTNNPNLFAPTEGMPPGPPMPLDVRGQINSGSFAYITRIYPRRWTIIDEERGITFGTFMFHHTGTVKSVTLPDGTVREMIPIARRPFSVVVSELFKVQAGKIREIEAVMTSLPYGASDGWE